MSALTRLIAEASVLAGGVHQCSALGHRWVSNGGRRCPRDLDACSQTVYECDSCGAVDYGECGGPGFADCTEGEPCGGYDAEHEMDFVMAETLCADLGIKASPWTRRSSLEQRPKEGV